MASWQPPIPSGALYSKPARALGPALALLAYCYDLVQRDGWFEVVLKEAAADMEEPYQTIKRWWGMIEDGEFFSAVENHKRKGLRVQFNADWIDWRVLSARTSPAFDPERTKRDTLGTNEVPDLEPQIEHTPDKGQLRDTLGTNEVPDLEPQKNVYGTHDSDQAVFAVTAFAAPPVRRQTRKPAEHTPEQHAYLDRKKAIEAAYVAELGYQPASFGREAKAAKFLAEQQYTPDQVLRCYRHLRADPFYDAKHISLQVVASQIGAFLATARASPARTPAIPIVRASEASKPPLSVEERRAILAEYDTRFR